MKSWIKAGGAPAWVLAAMCVVLSGALYWEWMQGQGLELRLTQLRKLPTLEATTKAVLPEFSLPDAEQGFPELASRSLFSTTRRSSGVAGKGGRSAMKKGQFVLVGVMVTPRQTSVLLRDVQTNKTEAVTQDGIVRGMTVTDVTASRVVLRQGADFEELPLNVQTGPKGATPPGAQITNPAAQPTAHPAPVAAPVQPVLSPASAPTPLPTKPLDAPAVPRAPSASTPLR